MKHVFLGHLSKENNTPDLAYKTVENILSQSHIDTKRDIKIELAKRNGISRPVVLEAAGL